MARPCSFDPDQALEQAIMVFWKEGYEGCGIDDLLSATGVARQSLYNTFGDKRTLFLRCLREYQAKAFEKLRERLAQGSVVEAFHDLFFGAVAEDDVAKRMGCLMINTAMELAHTDVEIADLVARHQRTFEDVFVEALEAGTARGELPEDFDCRGVGRFLVGALFGLKVLAKSDPRSPALEDTARLALRVFAAA